MKEICEKLNLIIENGDYKVKSSQKANLIDSEGYRYFLSKQNLVSSIRKNGKLAKFFCNNIFTKHNINLFIQKNYPHITIKNFGTLKNAKDSTIEFYCTIHNTTYVKSWNEIKNGALCNECGKEKYRKSRLADFNKIKNYCKEALDIEILEQEYISNSTPLAYICNKHKEKGVQYRSWADMQMKKHSCPYCAKESTIKIQSTSHEQFMSKINDFCAVEVVGTYINSKTKIKVKCKKCGKMGYMRPDHILNGVSLNCCVKSKGEEEVERVLQKLKIPYVFQKRFEDCRLEKPLPFDFYVPSLNTCIEFDGRQHFVFSNTFHKTEESFEKLKNRDKIKNEYCIKNSVNLIRIPYWEIKNIEKILTTHLDNFFGEEGIKKVEKKSLGDL